MSKIEKTKKRKENTCAFYHSDFTHGLNDSF